MDKKNLNRKRRSTDISLCKYGLSCYQKNPEHLKKFRHPDPPAESQNEAANEMIITQQKVGEPFTKETVSPQKKTVPGESKSGDLSGTQKLFPTPKFTETVQEALKTMPKDFFDFWDFCSSVNKSKPEDAFADLGLHLVGVYDLLSKKLPKNKEVLLHCNWRYFYDPPEFQTVVKMDGKDLYHIGYFRDEPAEKPTILASNSAALGPKLTLKGDNIFAAMYIELTDMIKKLKSKQQSKFSKILESLKKFAEGKKYALQIQTTGTKSRMKKVVAKTFHGLGIVVPFKNDVGYRPLPDTDATIKSLLKRIVCTENPMKRLQVEENLDELITNVQFANDECDYGMGLELGIDLFCFGETYFHSHVLNILPLAYNLLNRPKFGEIIEFHLANRRMSDELSDLKDI